MALMDVRCFRMLCLIAGLWLGCGALAAGVAQAAARLDRYYAHPTSEDANGVIAPWYKGQNGQIDERLRYAVEVYKRYPWIGTDKAVMAAPDFVYNSHWSISDEGEIGVPPTTDWMCGDLCQRAWSIVKGLTDHYRYSADPVAFLYIPLTVDYILDYGLTSDDYEGWPRFPISNPTNGKIRGKCDENGRMQLDFCARLGEDVLTAYKLTGNERYYEAAKHWADLMAQHCNFDPGLPPWNRYVNPWVVGWSDKLTGSTTMICQFLDEIIKTGYVGQDGIILRARDAGRAYVRNQMLPNWTKNEVWGRNYWDWDNPVTCGILSMCGDYILEYREGFPNWHNDLRNMLAIIFNRNGVDPGSMGEAYSGAWAFPESSTCCGNSLSYCQYTAAPTFIRLGAIADDPWASEIGRRMMIMATYDSDDKGVVKDGLLGAQVATGEWSNLAHPWSLCQIMEALAWAPETFGPARENHIMRSTEVVTSVVYDAGRVEYTTFSAPPENIDVLRLAFLPTRVTAGGKELELLPTLDRNGFTAKTLPCGDVIVTVRHDNYPTVVVTGDDPQERHGLDVFTAQGDWERKSDKSGAAWLETQETSATLQATFTGNQVRLIGRVDTQGGWAEVWLDGQKQKTIVECWNPHLRTGQVLYSRSGLTQGEHTLKIVALGHGNPISKKAKVCVEGLLTSSAQGDNGFGAGGGPAGAQRMIFGYTGRKDYLDKQGNPWRPATEFVIRSGYGTDSIKEALWTDRRTMFIAKTDDPELYRYGIHGDEFCVNVTVGPGKYDVILHFASTPLHPFLEKDIEGNMAMVRHIQNVDVNGERMAENMDVALEAGGTFTALTRTYPAVQPRNGLIDVRLTGCNSRQAILQALEIVPCAN